MSPTKSNKLALQGVVNKLSLADAMTLRDAFTYSSILEQCYSTRVDPVSYLSKKFKHPVTLLSAMFDTGCILVGSRALEFFVPGSSRDESAWKFFVPGYKESVSDMINALDKSGVAWQFDNPTTGHEFTTLYGRLHPSKGAQQVQLIIGNDRDDLRGGMSFLKEVYASHVQCFISGCNKDKKAWRSNQTPGSTSFEDSDSNEPAVVHP
ncbi:glucose 1-dehydrogenase [Purpureocillium lavendulum]|uniref:Glucose 1-dehydrogenase n=1 Tax=Purpureocillium lavendulum TaxID=1247861 RepID=A0AB34G1A4_9HYPO|nr:glucose 1-dehydrogenase [Purpureocillium lavendulum]